MRSTRTEILSLTGVRGIAALLIAIYHFGISRSASVAFPRFELTGAYLAVDAFFILSGFVLAYNYRDIFERTVHLNNYLDFMVRRVARIYPAYLAFIVIYIVKMTVNISGDNPFRLFGADDFIGNIFMMNGWGFSIYPIIGPSWSISAELACYFMLPFLIWFFCARRWRALLMPPIIMGLLLLLINSGKGLNGGLDIIDGTTPWPVVRAFCGFLTGIMLFQIDFRHYQRLTPYLDALTLSALGIGALLWLFDCSDLLKFLAIALLIMGLTQDTPIARRLFGTSLVHYLGTISYSLYLCHSLCIPIALRAGKLALPFIGLEATYIVTFALYIVMILILAATTYRIFEVGGKKAAMRMYRWLFRRRESHPVVEG